MNLILNFFEYIWYITKLAAFNILMITVQIAHAGIICVLLILFAILFAILFSGNDNSFISDITPPIAILTSIIFLLIGLYLEDKIIKKYSFIKRSTKIINEILFNIERKHSLWKARKYLAPYSDIKKNLKIQNNNIVIYIGTKASKTVICQDKMSKREISTKLKGFLKKATRRESWAYTDIWNIICVNFDDNATYDGIARLFAINDKSSTYSSFFSNYKFCINFEKKMNKNSRLKTAKNHNKRISQKNINEDSVITETTEENIEASTIDKTKERNVDF